MGEKIIDLGFVKMGDTDYSVELNHPSGGLQKEVHIQSKKSRIEMTESEFIELSTLILLAAEKLQNYKITK
jgi:hypothetical protein